MATLGGSERTSFFFEFVEFLYDELHIPITFILPYTRFLESTICLWFRKVKADEIAADNGIEPLYESPDKMAGVLTGVQTLLFGPLFFSQRATVTQSHAYHRR
jgi:hypothetical protein